VEEGYAVRDPAGSAGPETMMDWETRQGGLDEHQSVLVRQLAQIRQLRRRMGIMRQPPVYLGMEDFLLRHGEWFVARACEEKWEGPPKECFAHAVRLTAQGL